jgi:probable F420-dependent oxidoreductase
MAERPKIGVVFPQTEPVALDPVFARDFGQAAEELGFSHLLAYDHVLGAEHAGRDPKLRGPYTEDTPFREPFVLFAFLAGITSRIEFGTAVLVLPQRQTALVAKQAAEVDILCEGRFRLGIGVGWNPVEYDALGRSFGDRGARSAEQIDLLRRLFTERSVTFTGRSEHVTGAGIAPLPVQRPIPIWFGASTPPAFRRAGRLGDGWFPMVPPGPRLEEAKAIVEEGAREAGRDPSSIGMEGRVSWTPEGGLDMVLDHVERWRSTGATHLEVNTMSAGFVSVDDHLAALAKVADALELARQR